jgi:prolyl-tRNA editing enzyme YbaK/EbsC (Cys-tRNA(Pro) deacylase)
VFTSLQQARELGVTAEAVLKTVALCSAGKYELAVVALTRRDGRASQDRIGSPP